MSEILRFDHVTYTYAEGEEDRAALEDCSVSVQDGERIAVLGNNGAGKSTFFLLANGVLRPQSGAVCFRGKPVGKTSRELSALRRGVGLIFQDADAQILGGTVEEEISFGPMNLQLDGGEVRRRVDLAVENLKLEEFRRRAPQYLSGGEKKRVTIADVLAMDPELMLLDEPASSLDPANTRLLGENLDMLSSRGIALAVATHDVNFAWSWARRALVFCGGRLVADAEPETIFSDEALLRRCGLEQPLLFRAGRALGIDPLPRTAEEFETAAAALRREMKTK